MLYELKNVELFESGVDANGITFTNDDLQGIADAHRALGLDGKIPLKLGHNDQQPLTDGQPALGWAVRPRVVGNKLLVDFIGLPKVIYDLIKKGAYKQVSGELLRGVQAGTRKIPWVLDAVALLGADQPAFGALRDLQSLTMARGATPQHEARATFAMPRDTDADLRRQNELLQAQLREAQFKAITDVAIATGRVLPADVARFASVVPAEGRTVEAWAKYSAGIAPPKFRHGARALATESGEGLSNGGSASEQLNALVAQEVEAHRVKFGKVVQPLDVAATVWRRNPHLVEAWHDEQQVR